VLLIWAVADMWTKAKSDPYSILQRHDPYMCSWQMRGFGTWHPLVKRLPCAVMTLAGWLPGIAGCSVHHRHMYGMIAAVPHASDMQIPA
jgi:hypothetical protein